MNARLVFPLLSLAATACVTAPYNGSSLSLPSSSMTVSGYVHAAGLTVSIYASPLPGSTSTLLGTTISSSTPTPMWDGTELYSFRRSVTVPRGAWSTRTCIEDQTFIRVTAPGMTSGLLTYDDPNLPGGTDPTVCFADEYNAGSPFVSAMVNCRSADSPYARVTAPDDNRYTHPGNLTISSATDVAAHQCLRRVAGNLTIGGASTLAVSLPNLVSVALDMTVSYPRPTGVTVTARTIDAPLLTNVGGTLFLNSPAASASQVVTLPLGLSALTTVNNVALTVDAFNVNTSGLGALTTIPGNLSYVTGNGDTTGGFSTVTSIGGDVHLDLGHTVLFVLQNLATVGGDFALVDGNPTGAAVFSGLTSVGGDFTLGAVVFNGAPTTMFFPLLDTIGGRLSFNSTSLSVLNFGAAVLETSALTINSNGGLNAFAPSNIDVIGAGSIEITSNPALCTTLINTFLSGQASWTGTSIISGNGGC